LGAWPFTDDDVWPTIPNQFRRLLGIAPIYRMTLYDSEVKPFQFLDIVAWLQGDKKTITWLFPVCNYAIPESQHAIPQGYFTPGYVKANPSSGSQEYYSGHASL
jgi:hypothetical protein